MKKLIIGAVGTTLVLLGVILLVLPGPGILLIVAGVAVLAMEFPWARNFVEWVKQRRGPRT